MAGQGRQGMGAACAASSVNGEDCDGDVRSESWDGSAGCRGVPAPNPEPLTDNVHLPKTPVPAARVDC